MFSRESAWKYEKVINRVSLRITREYIQQDHEHYFAFTCFLKQDGIQKTTVYYVRTLSLVQVDSEGNFSTYS